MRRASPLLLALSLAACGGSEAEVARQAPEDAAITDALADPIMTDTDLTAQDQAQAAVAVSGPVTSALPPIDRSDEAVEAAREAAARQVGRSPPAVPDGARADLTRFREAITAGQMAAASRIAGIGCAAKVEYTARWAAALPVALQVYPRGAVEEAAGTDADGCGLRVVHFKTPVVPDDVVAFYYARLKAAGHPAAHEVDHAGDVLRGRMGAVTYAIYVRIDEDGLTATDIIASGV